MTDSRWTEEPTGEGTAYMVRFTMQHLRGFAGFRWPRYGYTETSRDYGLCGYLHGEGDYAPVIVEYLRGSALPPYVQVLVVREAEVWGFSKGTYDADSHRVRRCWVKYTGLFEDVCMQLRSEGAYGSTVASNMERCLAKSDLAEPNGHPWIYKALRSLLDTANCRGGA